MSYQTILFEINEGVARSLGLTGLLGSPVIARADRRPSTGGRA